MAGFHVSVPHALGHEAALVRVQKFLDDVRENYAAHMSDVRGQWNGNRLEFGFSATGLPVQGTLVVDDAAVHVSGPLPLAALLFRGKIEQTIRQELEKLLS
ncbi:MAG: polyhydroxyalkanoic acid system family protein [Planctomycetaceae bacterium]|nr:polyhydroxyalkanoic acid system family protein [Planctomycetaceae bacterium]